MTVKALSQTRPAISPNAAAVFASIRKHLDAAMDSVVKRAVSEVAPGANVTYKVKQGQNGTLTIVIATEKSGKSTITPAKPKPAPVGIEVALAAATARGQIRVAEILAGEDMAGADDFAAMLGITRQSLHDKRDKHQVLGLEGAKRGYKFPTWQIDQDGKPLSALPDLFAALDGPWSVYRFLKQHHPELGDITGLEAVRSGLTSDALALAANIERSSA